MKINLLIGGLALAITGVAVWAGDAPETKMVVRAVLELTDGSRLVGTPLDAGLKMSVEFSKISVPLKTIQQCKVLHKEQRVSLTLQNGDQVTGTAEDDSFQLQTMLGRLAPSFAQIDRITFSAYPEGGLPPAAPAEGTIAFGGVNWLPWKTLFEVQGDKLVSLPKARPGFNYGHSGSGRGPTLMANIDDPAWKDYSFEFELAMTGVDPSFNPYGLPQDFRGAAVFFHVVDAKESWNECGGSTYTLGLSPDGKWNISCAYNSYCPCPVGYCESKSDGNRNLGEGQGPKLDSVNGNKFRIEIVGKRIRVWVDGEKIIDVVDEKMNETIGGKTLDHGGVGFHWGMDSMGWIRHFSVKPIQPEGR